jgi:hypothetical protein
VSAERALAVRVLIERHVRARAVRAFTEGHTEAPARRAVTEKYTEAVARAQWTARRLGASFAGFGVSSDVRLASRNSRYGLHAYAAAGETIVLGYTSHALHEASSRVVGVWLYPAGSPMRVGEPYSVIAGVNALNGTRATAGRATAVMVPALPV